MVDENYNHFLIDRLGDVFLYDPEGMGAVDRENLIQALQEFSFLDPFADPNLVENSSITSALAEYRHNYVLGVDDMNTLQATLEGSIPLEVSGPIIRLNMDYFDQEFQDAMEDLVRLGYISPFDFSNPDDVEVFNNLRASFRSDFEAIQPVIVPELVNDTTAAERAANNPENRSFVMITPHDHSLGADLQYRMETRAKWEATKDALEDAGAHVITIDGTANDGSGREVYVRDRAVIIGDIAYIPDFEYAITSGMQYEEVYNYQKDAEQIAEFLAGQGYEVIHVQDAWFEGGNVVLHPTNEQNTIFLGMDGTTDVFSANNLIAAINSTQTEQWTLQGVPLVDTYEGGSFELYHLDLGMTYALPNGEIIIYPGVTDEETYTRIQEIVGADNIIEIDRETALTFSTNFNHVGNTIIMTGTTPELTEILEGRGYEVVSPEDYGMETFEFGLGGVHCITNEIRWRPPTNG